MIIKNIKRVEHNKVQSSSFEHAVIKSSMTELTDRVSKTNTLMTI